MQPKRLIFIATAMLSLAACKGDVRDVAVYIANAQKYTDEGDTSKARVELQNALKIQPNNPAANLAMARNRENAGDVEGSITYYVRAAQPDARLLEPQLRVISILLDGGRLREALGRSNITLGAFPNNAEALAMRADIEERQSQLGPARKDVDAAFAIDGRNARATSVRARLLLRNNDVDGAYALIQQGLVQHPDDINLLQVEAAIALTLQQPDRAASAFRAIVKLRPHNAIAQRALADLEANTGGLDQAINNFRETVEANPADEDLQLSFVDFLSKRSTTDNAVSYLRKLIGEHKADNTYDLILAEFYNKKGDLKQARAVFDDAVQRLGDSKAATAIHVAQAKLDVSAGQPDKALTKLQSVLATDPQNSEALLTRAAIEIKSGQTSQAITDLLSVVRTDPVNGRAFETLAAAYVYASQPALAVDAMRHSVAVTPGVDGANLKLAMFLQANGAVIESKELLARLTSQYPNLPALWVTNARLAIERGDWDMVATSLARLRNLPDTKAQADTIDGQLQLGRGDNAKAFASLKAALVSGQSIDPPLIVSFSRASLASQNAEQGIALITGLLPSLKDEALSSALTSLIAMQTDAGHPDRAEATYQRLVQLDPTAPGPPRLYVQLLVAEKQFDKADRVVAQALAAGAPRSEMLVMQGAIKEQRGDRRGALDAYQAAMEANPSSLEAINNYASVLADSSPKDEAALRSARDKLNGQESSGSAVVVDTIAWLDYRLQRFGEAKALLQRIDAAKSPIAQIRFHLAAVLLATGDKAGGLALLDTVKGQSFPGSDEASALSAT